MVEESKQSDLGAAIGKQSDVEIGSKIQAAISEGAGNLALIVEKLLGLEKKARLAGDATAVGKVAVQIARSCWEARDLAQLNANILVVVKRRAQLKQAIAELVQEAMTYVDQIPSRDDRLQLVSTLRTVTDGKIYVEVERARLTRTLAGIREAEGKIAEAAEVLQEVAVETFGSMDKREKAEFLLEQVRLTSAHGDWVRTAILANKVNKKVLDEPGFEDIRTRFYALLIQLHEQRHDSLAIHKDYAAVAKTRGLEGAPLRAALESMVLYLALSAWDNEVSDAMHRLRGDARLEAVPAFRALVVQLTTHEIIPWPLPAPHGDAIRAHASFSLAPPTVSAAATASAGGVGKAEAAAAAEAAGRSALAVSGALASSVVSKEDEARAGWAAVLHKRVLQHNVRVVAKWYQQVPVARLSALLAVDAPTAEAVLSELVAEKALWARIDRPAGVVSFVAPRAAAEVLGEWVADIGSVLDLLDTTAQLINKEYLVAANRPPGAAGGGGGGAAAAAAMRVEA